MNNELEKNIKRFLSLLGEDPKREGLIDTPKRVGKAWKELLRFNPDFDLTVFNSNGYDEMIISKNIKYHTFCEHHLLPFFGEVHIGYIPKKKIVGLSKLARTVEFFSKRLNTQEYFTENIANFLNERLNPRGIGVITSGRHMCQEMRGIKKEGNMITSSLKGIFLEKKRVKQEFLSLIKGV